MKRKATIVLGLSLIIVVSTSIGIYYGLEKKKSNELNKLEIPEGLNFYKTSGAFEFQTDFFLNTFRMQESYSPTLYIEYHHKDLNMFDYNPILNVTRTEYQWWDYTQIMETNKSFIPIWVNHSISSDIIAISSFNVSSPDLEVPSINRGCIQRTFENVMDTGLLYCDMRSTSHFLLLDNNSVYITYYSGLKDVDNFIVFLNQNTSTFELLTHQFNLTETFTVELNLNIFVYHDEAGLKVIDQHYSAGLGNLSIKLSLGVANTTAEYEFDGWLRDYQYVFLDMADLPETKAHLVDYNATRIEGDNLIFYNS